MERVLKVLQSMINHIDNLIKSSNKPTIEQFTNKVKDISISIQKEISSMHKKVKDIVSIAFSEMGWNINRQKCINSKIFTLSKFHDTLIKIFNQFQNYIPNVVPTSMELSNFSLACDRLWELDINRLLPEVDYILNFQNGKQMYDITMDVASLPLFTFIDENIFLKPTFTAFINLLDNYIANTGISEIITDEEKVENMTFLNTIMETPVMQYTHQYLLNKGKTKALNRKQFISELNELWFGLYTRKTHHDSSGFEHVFVGEIKDNTKEIIGFHNWIRIYLEEKNNKSFDYRGFIKPKRRSIDSCYLNTHMQLATIQFEWLGALKKASTSFFGTSPEFEFALYTLCFYFGDTEYNLKLGPYKLNITCHRWVDKYKKREFIATSFPSESPLDENEAATKIQSQYRSKLVKNKMNKIL